MVSMYTVFSLIWKREQYGSRDLVYGTYWTAQPLNVEYSRKNGDINPAERNCSLARNFKLIYDLPDAQLAAQWHDSSANADPARKK